MSELIERLKNKINYYIYKTVNDDDANKFAEEKKEEEPVKPEVFNDTPAATTDTKITPASVVTKIWSYIVYIFQVAFFPCLAVLLASFIANDLIIYPPGVRLIFFIFTLFICITQVWIASGLGLIYFGKKLYEIYLNRERDDKPNPPIRIMPKIFAILPLMVKDPNKTGFFEFFKYPFQYLKEIPDEPNKNGFTYRGILTDLMDKYKASLSESFPYYEQVKDKPIFKSRQIEFDEQFDKMHEQSQLIQPKEELVEAPLPSTIEENQAKKEANIKMKANAEAALERKKAVQTELNKQVKALTMPLQIGEKDEMEKKIGEEYNRKKANPEAPLPNTIKPVNTLNTPTNLKAPLPNTVKPVNTPTITTPVAPTNQVPTTQAPTNQVITPTDEPKTQA